MTLTGVILRHGGEAAEVQGNFGLGLIHFGELIMLFTSTPTNIRERDAARKYPHP
jgi:hypothetical protein